MTLTANGPSRIQLSNQSSTQEQINSTLNKQVLYNPFPSSVPRSVIESMNIQRDSDNIQISDGNNISTKCNDDAMNYEKCNRYKEDLESMYDVADLSDNSSNGCYFYDESSSITASDRLSSDQNNTMETNDVTPNYALRITQKDPMFEASLQLAAETTLTNLITKYRMPMRALKTIMNWP